MTWKEREAQGRAEPHRAPRRELEALRGAIARNRHDATVRSVSADNRFGLAFEAALLLSKMAIACAGFRIKGPGAHATSFQALELAMGSGVAAQVDYLDRCRRK